MACSDEGRKLQKILKVFENESEEGVSGSESYSPIRGIAADGGGERLGNVNTEVDPSQAGKDRTSGVSPDDDHVPTPRPCRRADVCTSTGAGPR